MRVSFMMKSSKDGKNILTFYYSTGGGELSRRGRIFRRFDEEQKRKPRLPFGKRGRDHSDCEGLSMGSVITNSTPSTVCSEPNHATVTV